MFKIVTSAMIAIHVVSATTDILCWQMEPVVRILAKIKVVYYATLKAPSASCVLPALTKNHFTILFAKPSLLITQDVLLMVANFVNPQLSASNALLFSV